MTRSICLLRFFYLFSIIKFIFSAVLITVGVIAVNAATINVPSGGSLQAALNSAQPGDEIVLEAGATYVGPFILPVKSGAAYITVRSSAMTALPSGVRVTPANAASMPKIVTPGTAEPAVQTVPGAHHFQFIGIEFKPVNAQAFIYDLIRLGSYGSEQNTLEQVPHHIIFDRCYIHAEPMQSLKRGIALNSAETKIINSYISDFKAAGQDSQAICGWNGPGPFTIVNNYLEGAGENVMFGGAAPSIPNLVPSDIEFRRNNLAKPLEWRGVWMVKNLFELKNARRILIDGNVFERNWAHGQQGFAIQITVRNDDGVSPWNTIEDVRFTNNIIRHSGSAINILGRDDIYPSQQATRITIKNNFIEDINRDAWGGNGIFLQITETNGITVDHNTILHNGNIINVYGVPTVGFVFMNNLMNHNEYGVHGDSAGVGTDSLNRYFPGYVFQKNLIAGAPVSIYPANNFYPANLSDAQFINQSGGNYRLASSSPYKNVGTDGKDIGCDFNGLQSAIDGSTPTSFSEMVAALQQNATVLAQSNNPSRPDIQTLINNIQQARQMLGQNSNRQTSQQIDEALLNAAAMASKAARFRNALARKYLLQAAFYLERAAAMSQV